MEQRSILMPKRVEKDAAYYRRLYILGAGLALGSTVKDSAEAAGISERYAYDILNKEEADINAFRDCVRPLTRTRREIENIARDKAEAKFEEKLGKAFAALDAALDADDPKTALEAAKETFNRLFGKAAATLNVTGGVKHTHTLQLSPAQAQAFALDAEEDFALTSKANRLLAPPREAVVDVTPS